MTLRDCMLYAGIRTSQRFARLSWFERDFFYGLLHAAWPAGRFESDVEILRAALYGPLLSKVSKRDVQNALVQCHEVGLIKLWTDDSGRGWGEVTKYRQTGLRKRKSSDDADPPPIPPPDDGPGLWSPKPAPQTEGKKEGRGTQATPAPKKESDADWRARLAKQYPHIDLDREFAQATKYQTRAGKKLDRLWFERHWLANIGEPVSFATAANGQAAPIEPEPEAWGVWLEEAYPGNVYAKGGSHEGTPWAELPATVRAKIARELRA